MTTIAIASDHRGFNHKRYILDHIISDNDMATWVDFGAFNADRSDYPLFAHAVCRAILEHRVDLGVLLCGSGVGMSIAANRFKGIYAALAWNEEVARISREHDCANILVLPADYISLPESIMIIRAWLMAMPLIDRHKDRLSLIDSMI